MTLKCEVVVYQDFHPPQRVCAAVQRSASDHFTSYTWDLPRVHSWLAYIVRIWEYYLLYVSLVVVS